jgi:D-lactate dehydrogenase (cytochrome)
LAAVSSSIIHARPPRHGASVPRAVRDPALLAAYLSDAAHVPGGYTDTLFAPDSEAEVAAILQASSRVLAIGAQSSLTGGATPLGDTILSTRRLTAVVLEDSGRVRAGAGATLSAIDRVLAAAGRSYPPVPTFIDACVGGVVSTNAAGASTFKYGSTRRWVQAMTVVLATGDVIDLARGRTYAHPDGYFELVREGRIVRIPIPRYRMPAVPKLSAGYFAAPEMDLIDLFIGSEGTLGVITEVTLETLPSRTPQCLAFVTFDDRRHALGFVTELREAAMTTWQRSDASGMDIAGIEHMDARSLALLREDGIQGRTGVAIPSSAVMGLLVTLELPSGTTATEAYSQIARADDAQATAAPLTTFVQTLARFGVIDRAELSVPGDRGHAQRLLDVREAVPVAVNRRVGLAQSQIDRRIEKTAGDMIVPFDRIGELLDAYDTAFAARGLDAAVWGHISDGNLHPNVIPRGFEDVETGRALMLEFGRLAIRLGGAPLAEHGVGRNKTKQRLLEELYGADGIAAMRAVKQALDPEDKLARGNIFSAEQHTSEHESDRDDGRPQ